MQLRVSFLLLAIAIVGAAQTWQSATLTETAAQLSINGFAAYPQIGLVIALQLLVLFGSRYWKFVPALIAMIIGAALSALAILPILQSTMSNRWHLLQSQITAATGLADWLAQREAISDLQVNTLAIWLTIGALALLQLWNFRSPFLRRAATKRTDGDWVN